MQSMETILNLTPSYLFLPQLLSNEFKNKDYNYLELLYRCGLSNVYIKDLVNDPLSKFENNIYLLFEKNKFNYVDESKKFPIISSKGILSVREFFDTIPKTIEIYEVDDFYDMVIYRVEDKLDLYNIFTSNFSKIPEEMVEKYYNNNSNNIFKFAKGIIDRSPKILKFIENKLELKIPDDVELFSKFSERDYFLGSIKIINYNLYNQLLKF